MYSSFLLSYSNKTHICFLFVVESFDYVILDSLLPGGGEADWSLDEHPPSSAGVIPSQLSSGQVSLE